VISSSANQRPETTFSESWQERTFSAHSIICINAIGAHVCVAADASVPAKRCLLLRVSRRADYHLGAVERSNVRSSRMRSISSLFISKLSRYQPPIPQRGWDLFFSSESSTDYYYRCDFLIFHNRPFLQLNRGLYVRFRVRSVLSSEERDSLSVTIHGHSRRWKRRWKRQKFFYFIILANWKVY